MITLGYGAILFWNMLWYCFGICCNISHLPLDSLKITFNETRSLNLEYFNIIF